jgi:hypothetical protein
MSRTYTYHDFETLYEKGLKRLDEFGEAPGDLASLKPDSSTWSVREVYQHLIQFNGMYYGQIQKVLGNEEPVIADNESFKPRLPFRFFISMLEPPYRVKFKTIAPMYPGDVDEKDPAKCLSRLKEINRKIFEKIRFVSEKSLDTDRMKGGNPVLQWIPMTLTEMLLIVDAHQRRHFLQIEKTFQKLSGESY